MVRGTTRCRGCGILHEDDLLLPQKKWHGSVCSICHCLNCSINDGYYHQLPRRDSVFNPDFCAASRERRRLAVSRSSQRSGTRGAAIGDRLYDFSGCFPDVDVARLSLSHLYMYHFELTSRLRCVAAELRRRAEAFRVYDAVHDCSFCVFFQSADV